MYCTAPVTPDSLFPPLPPLNVIPAITEAAFEPTPPAPPLNSVVAVDCHKPPAPPVADNKLLNDELPPAFPFVLGVATPAPPEPTVIL